MDKKDKQSLNRRLLLIYVCYFVVIGLGFFLSYMPVFSRGFAAGMDAAQQEIESSSHGIEKRWYLFSVHPSLFSEHSIAIDSRYENIGIELSGYDALAAVTVSSTDPDNDPAFAMVSRNYTKTMFISMGISLSWLAILILIGVIINSLRRSIRDQRPLPDSNILYMRIIGILIIASELLKALAYHIGQQTVQQIADRTMSFINAYPIEYGNIVLGLLVLFSAEVFAIGVRLGEEQRLTI